ncbi:MAG: hypothetical protein LBT24_06795 [Tannerella sp.]|jgi:hypothetical protein|nr:hypothetical protein [Tannerella sp.]
MKKNLIYSIILCLGLSLISCQNEEDNWYSETFDYSGRFVIGVYAEDGTTELVPVDTKNELQIYNSSANTADEIWIDVVKGWTACPLKGKFNITGSSETFSAIRTENIKSSNMYIETAEYGLIPFKDIFLAVFPEITAAGQKNAGVQEYTYVTLTEGKISPQSATSPGGNTVDGIYLKITLYNDNIQFVSAETDPETWFDSDVPEYEWTYESSSNSFNQALTTTFVIKGYRYTGYPEDR